MVDSLNQGRDLPKGGPRSRAAVVGSGWRHYRVPGSGRVVGVGVGAFTGVICPFSRRDGRENRTRFKLHRRNPRGDLVLFSFKNVRKSYCKYHLNGTL